jgi:trimethylamine--corrinoid protein Co-methyltransferase
VFGPGHFLGSKQTLELMKSEYLYPKLANRQPYGQWEEGGKIDAFEQAHAKVQAMMARHYPSYIDPAVDARIRAAFPILLSPEDKAPGNSRWP